MPHQPTRDRIKVDDISTTPRPQRRPDWIRVRAPMGENYERLQTLMRSKSLNTVCEEAMCPNIGDCWGRGTATFLMMGDICTRTCGFCDIKRGAPNALDWIEPERVAQAVRSMQLRHTVITSVNRDDRKDGGAPILCYRAGDDLDEADFIARTAHQALRDDVENTMAVLYRTNAQSRTVD